MSERLTYDIAADLRRQTDLSDATNDLLHEAAGKLEGLIDLLAKAETDRDCATAEAEDLRALVATCVCQSWPPEGPTEDCPVHGAVRAFNEATAEIAAMRPVVELARKAINTPITAVPLVLGAIEDALRTLDGTETAHVAVRLTETTLGVGDETSTTSSGPQNAAEPPVLEEPFVAVTRSDYAALRRGAGSLVADLLAVSANLEEHIQTRAQEIAANAVAEANAAMRRLADRAAFDSNVQARNAAKSHAQMRRVVELAAAWRAAGKIGEAQDIHEALHPKEDEVTTNV